MPEKIEQIMKKIHIMLANCETSAYSSEDVIVSKKRLFALLEQLNYAVYEVMEQYEATTASRDRAQAMQERMAAEIKEDAVHRAEDVYAASLLYTQDMLSDMKNMTEYMYYKAKGEYEELMQNYEERMRYIRENESEIVAQLTAMADAKTYLHMIEETHEKRDAQFSQEFAKQKAEEVEELAAAQAADPLSAKLTAPIVVTVHEQPQIPEGFAKKKEKRMKQKAEQAGEEIEEQVSEETGEKKSFRAEELDKEYFDWREETAEAGEADENSAGKGASLFKGLKFLPKKKK